MKNFSAKVLLFIADMFVIALSIAIAYYIRIIFRDLFELKFDHSIDHYILFPYIYVVTLSIFIYEEIYTKRYDFWQETLHILKSLLLSFFIIMAILAFTKNIDQFSRAIIIFSYLLMAFLIPLEKYLLKKYLFYLGLWKRPAKILGSDPFLSKEIFNNPYLGYISNDNSNAKTIFINSKDYAPDDLKKVIAQEIQQHHEVIFIPIINDFNISQSHVYELFNTRTNLIVFQNRLKSKCRLILKELFNYTLALLLLPILLPIIGIVAILIKKESPGPVFFAHQRIGKGGRIIPTFKFRSMYQDAQERLEQLLAEDEEAKKEWERSFKLKDDPRVTKIGAFLRKTSLDELPQIFNVLRGEMSFVGPRPVIQQELDLYYKENAVYYKMVKPGITGLWQVSGRSDTDYDFRVSTDKWYVSNWSLWLDIVILFKTAKVVLFREGAY